MKILLAVNAALALAFASALASAAPMVYVGNDVGMTSPPFTNSDAAAAQFDATAGTSPAGAITFEGLATGNFSALEVAPGVTVTLTNTDSTLFGGITNAAFFLEGYNTTVGGEQHLRVVPKYDGGSGQVVSVRFDFDSPINSFGFYLSGAGDIVYGPLSLSFNDGTAQVLPIARNQSASTQFFGFTDIGASISSVTLQSTGPFLSIRDIFGIDDVRYAVAPNVNAAEVPEPTSIALWSLLSVAGLTAWRRRKRFTVI